MKKRTGFVSNSSSSSFICDITGRVESGTDIYLEEAEMYECQNGHTFDEKFYLKPSIQQKRDIVLVEKDNSEEHQRYKEKAKTLNDENFEEWFEDEYLGDAFNRGKINPLFCPICSFRYGKPKEIMLFLLAREELKLSEILSQLRMVYGDWNTFNDKLLRNVKGEAFNDLDYNLENK